MNLHKLNLTFSFELIVTSEEKLITLPTQREGLEYLDQILNSSLENIEDYEVFDAPIAKSEGFPVHPVTLSIRLSLNRQWVVCPRA